MSTFLDRVGAENVRVMSRGGASCVSTPSVRPARSASSSSYGAIHTARGAQGQPPARAESGGGFAGGGMEGVALALPDWVGTEPDGSAGGYEYHFDDAGGGGGGGGGCYDDDVGGGYDDYQYQDEFAPLPPAAAAAEQQRWDDGGAGYGEYAEAAPAAAVQPEPRRARSKPRLGVRDLQNVMNQTSVLRYRTQVAESTARRVSDHETMRATVSAQRAVGATSAASGSRSGGGDYRAGAGERQADAELDSFYAAESPRQAQQQYSAPGGRYPGAPGVATGIAAEIMAPHQSPQRFAGEQRSQYLDQQESVRLDAGPVVAEEPRGPLASWEQGHGAQQNEPERSHAKAAAAPARRGEPNANSYLARVINDIPDPPGEALSSLGAAPAARARRTQRHPRVSWPHQGNKGTRFYEQEKREQQKEHQRATAQTKQKETDSVPYRRARTVEYTPYTMEDFRNIKPTDGHAYDVKRDGLGKLGPDLEDPKLIAKREARERMRQYSAAVKTGHQKSLRFVPREQPTGAPGGKVAAASRAQAKAKRDRGLQYASTIPRPEVFRELTPEPELPEIEAPPPVSGAISRLQELELQHERDQERARQIAESLDD